MLFTKFVEVWGHVILVAIGGRGVETWTSAHQIISFCFVLFGVFFFQIIYLIIVCTQYLYHLSKFHMGSCSRKKQRLEAFFYLQRRLCLQLHCIWLLVEILRVHEATCMFTSFFCLFCDFPKPVLSTLKIWRGSSSIPLLKRNRKNIWIL